MATSGVVTFNPTRDQVITAALRKVNAIGEGETPSTDAVTETAFALNTVLKALQVKGMPLWKITEYTLTYVASQRQYTVGVGGDLSVIPPLKVFQAWDRTGAGTSTQADKPLLVIPRFDMNILGGKLSAGPPNQVWYDPPGTVGSSGNPRGTMTVFPVPDSTTASTHVLVFTGQAMAEDVTAASDTLDWPQYWDLAIIYELARHIAPDNGVGLAERAQLANTAKFEVDEALSFGTEEGSLLIRPTPNWDQNRA